METTLNKNISKETSRRSGSFMMLAKKMFIENRKTLLMLCGGYLGALAVVGIWSGFNGVYSSSTVVIIYSVLASLLCAVLASLMFHDFTTKEGRINALMTPASRTEKFWLRLIAVIPGAVLLTIAGYYVLAGFMNLTAGISHDVWVPIYGITDFFRWFGDDGIFPFLSSFILSEGLFIFGAIAWPRKSFLKTLLVQAGISFVCSIFMVFAARFIIRNYTVIVNDPEALLWIATSVIAAIGLALIYAAYVVFKRKTII